MLRLCVENVTMSRFRHHVLSLPFPSPSDPQVDFCTPNQWDYVTGLLTRSTGSGRDEMERGMWNVEHGTWNPPLSPSRNRTFLLTGRSTVLYASPVSARHTSLSVVRCVVRRLSLREVTGGRGGGHMLWCMVRAASVSFSCLESLGLHGMA